MDTAFSAGVGAITGPIFDKFNLGSKISQSAGDELSNLAANTEDAEAKSMLYRLSAFVTGGDLPSWFKGSTDEWNEAIASHINEIFSEVTESVADGLQDRFKINDKISEYLKGILEGGSDK